jgi:hypothetical protein
MHKISGAIFLEGTRITTRAKPQARFTVFASIILLVGSVVESAHVREIMVCDHLAAVTKNTTCVSSPRFVHSTHHTIRKSNIPEYPVSQ